MHMLYAYGANRIIGRGYPEMPDSVWKERSRGHGLRQVYERLIKDLDGRDLKNALEFCYQRALHSVVVDILVDDQVLTSFTLEKDTPFRETVIGGIADGVEYTHDHSRTEDALFGDVRKTDFSKMPQRTFEEFLGKADSSCYGQNMRWTDYYWRDHEFGRPYTVVGEDFFARLVKEIVTLSHQQWVWDDEFAKRWVERRQYVVVNKMRTLANQNLENGTRFADPVSMEKAMERLRAFPATPEHCGATDNPDFDCGRLYHRKWRFTHKSHGSEEA